MGRHGKGVFTTVRRNMPVKSCLMTSRKVVMVAGGLSGRVEILRRGAEVASRTLWADYLSFREH